MRLACTRASSAAAREFGRVAQRANARRRPVVFAPYSGRAASRFSPGSHKTRGAPAAQINVWQHQLFNNHVNAAVTGTFLVLVALVVLTCARVWWQLLAGKRAADLREEPYVAVAAVRSAP